MDDLPLRDHRPPPFWCSRYGLGWLALAAVAGWFLLTEHRAHLFGVLPWLLLFACPLMHVLMHRGHQGNRGPRPDAGRGSIDEPPARDNPGAPR
jgi:hypothetical protein